MSFLFVNQAEEILAKYLVNKSPSTAENLVLRLFQNNWTPADGDDEGDVTEATFTGYSSINLAGSDWTITPNAPTLLETAEKTFTSTADQTPQNIYGYYLTQASSGKLVCAWRFNDAPYVMQANNDKILVTPKINIKKASEV